MDCSLLLDYVSVLLVVQFFANNLLRLGLAKFLTLGWEGFLTRSYIRDNVLLD